MPRVTLPDCARCPMLKKCDAHITGGTWPHRKGIDPCIVDLSGEHPVQVHTLGVEVSNRGIKNEMPRRGGIRCHI